MVYVLTDLTAGNAAANLSGTKNTGTEDILWLPAVLGSSSLPGSALRDGCIHVLGLRIVVLEALRRHSVPAVAAAAFEYSPDVAASPVPAVAAAAISRRFIFSVSDDSRFPDVAP